MSYKKHRSATTRRQDWDYGANASYFITINTKDRERHFGEVVWDETLQAAAMALSAAGALADKCWKEITAHYPFVIVDEHIVMPDHLHGILIFDRPVEMKWTFNQFGRQSGNLQAVVRGFKCTVQRLANELNLEMAWQPKYWDRIIRDERELFQTRNYLRENPKRWFEKYGAGGRADIENGGQ